MNTAVCPGSFDPITTGHLDVIRRVATLYERVVVGVAKTPPKKPLFPVEERVKFVEAAIKEFSNVSVEAFDNLAVEFAESQGAHTIVRGLRAVSDFEHEFQMAQLNRELNASVETVFIMASSEFAYLSSSAVKEIAQYGGNVKGLVPPVVEKSFARFFVKG